MTKHLSVHLLGAVQIQRGAPAAGAPLRRKTKALLAYLIATRKAHTRGYLSDLFCQESDDPARALRWHLSALRRQLGPEAIQANAETVQINTQALWTDVWLLEQSLPTPEKWETAVSLYQGDFLAGLALPDSPEFEIWLLGERTRLRQLYENALAKLITELVAQEAYETAVSWAQKLVQSNPLLEEAHIRLIWLYGRTGQRPAALAQYEQCREILWRELAVEPSTELTAVYEAVHRGDFRRLKKQAEVNTTNLGETVELVGREAELAQLRQAWRTARQGQGRVVLIEADAGVGKTRLVQALIAEASPAFVGRCYESSRALPYTPWAEILESRLADERIWATIDRFWLEQLARLLPSLALRLALPELPADGEEERLFTAVFHALYTVDRQPTLLFLDDLQWADEATLRLFHYLARRVGSTGLLLVGTFRSEEMADNPAVPMLFSDLRRGKGLSHLHLKPFDLNDVYTLTVKLWPNLPEGYRLHVCQMVQQATGGNPLFLTELLRELAHTREIPGQLPVPPSLQELVQRRLRQLPESGRQVVEAMAVLSVPCTPAQAQQTSARSEEETVTAVDLGWQRRLLTATAAGLYHFSHDLLREAVLAQMSQVRCQLLNRRAAMMLAQTAVRLEAERRQEAAGRIMRHAWAGQDFALVLQWAEAASGHARRLFATGEALLVWQTAVAALDQLQQAGDINRQTAERQRLRFLLNQAELLSLSGRWPEETPLLAEAADLLVRQPAPEVEAAFYLRRATWRFNQGQNEAAWEDIQGAVSRYLALEENDGIADAHYMAGRIKINLGQNREAQPLLMQALALYQENGDLSGEALCLSSLAVALGELGQIQVALEQLLPRALAIAEQQRDLPGQARAAFVTAASWNLFYHAPQMRFYAEKVRLLGEELQDEALLDRASYLLANAAILEGQIDAGLALWRQIYRSAHARGDRWLEGWAAHILGRLALGRGELEKAEQWLTAAFHLRQEMGEAQNLVNDLAWMGRLRLAQGLPDQALAYTAEAIRKLETLRQQVYVIDTCDIYMAQAEALMSHGRDAEALVTLKQAHKEMMDFAVQIKDEATRQSYFNFLHMARIGWAWERGQIRPYPL